MGVLKNSRRRRVLALIIVFGLTFSGCLTLGPSLTADTSESAVFESLSTDEPWAGNHVRVNATLRSSPEASNTTTITVIGENKQEYTTISVASGQTTVPLWIPTNEDLTLVASNSINSTTTGTLNVTSSGNQVI